jgi:hypothetical protein
MRSGLTPEQDAIARAVLFASLFDYPLTLAELRRTLVESRQTPTRILANYTASPMLARVIDWRDGLFFPRSRPELPGIRRDRERRSRAFLARHRVFLRLACALPFVRMVALSGSIAHLNLEEGGDLDLFVVTRGRHAWSVTLALVLLAKLTGRRREVCANFVTADSRLRFEPEDLFTASQLLHLRPLVGHDVHAAILEANTFVRCSYPNARLSSTAARQRRAGSLVKRMVEAVLLIPAGPVEAFCRVAYGRYLRAQSSRWTSPEQVRLDHDRLKLHTRSHRHAVLARFEALVHDTLDAHHRSIA